MGTNVSLVVACLDDETRAPAWTYAENWWYSQCADMWDELVISVEPGGRAAALNQAIRDSTGTVIIQADADSLVPPETLRQAINLATLADGLVVPHSRYLYLTEAATGEVYAGRDPFTCGPDDCDESGAGGVGNVTVFSRTTWEACGGYDERFGGWGGDDGCFAVAAEAFTGRPTRRLVGDVVHCWHPRPAASIVGSMLHTEQFALVAQYRDAAAIGPDAVRKLVADR
jgi:hypothetical protein